MIALGNNVTHIGPKQVERRKAEGQEITPSQREHIRKVFTKAISEALENGDGKLAEPWTFQYLANIIKEDRKLEGKKIIEVGISVVWDPVTPVKYEADQFLFQVWTADKSAEDRRRIDGCYDEQGTVMITGIGKMGEEKMIADLKGIAMITEKDDLGADRVD